MKRTAIALASALAIAPAFAQWNGPYYYSRSNDNPQDYATVIESTPVYANAREECWNPNTAAFEARRDTHARIGGGTALGAVAGGVIGNQVNPGEGAVAGAILGGIIGHQVERERARADNDLDLSNCRMANDASAIEGYDVHYRYGGRDYVARMNNDPGDSIRIGTDVNWDGTPFA